MFRTLSAKLTSVYALVFAVLSLLAFLAISQSLKMNLMQRLDNDFISDGSEFIQVFQQGGLELLTNEVKLEAEGEGVDKIFIRVFAPNSEVLIRSNMAQWRDIPDRPPLFAYRNMIGFESLDLPSRNARARIFYQPLGDGYVLQSGALLTRDETLIATAQKEFALAFFVMLLCAVLIGRYISSHALIGVGKVREMADQISRGNLSCTLEFQDQAEEVNDLITSINRMQSRIRNLIKELQDVTNNIAHDLRSPLTRIRGLVETTLSGNQTVREYQEMSGAVIEECDSLVSTINTMLDIAEIDAGLKPLEKKELNVADILRDVVELYTPLAEDKKIDLAIQLTDECLETRGNRSSLQRAFANLLDNALKFTPAQGRVRIDAVRDNGDLRIVMTDTGIGIAKTDLQHVFERFYRGDRSRSTPGTGLGLSLVNSIIRSHGGRIEIQSHEETGTCMTIFLTASAPGQERPLSPDQTV